MTSTYIQVNNRWPRLCPSNSLAITQLFLRNLDTLPQALNLELLARAPAVDIPDVVGRGLKVASRIVALGYEDLVLDAIIQRLIQRNRCSLSVMSAERLRTLVAV